MAALRTDRTGPWSRPWCSEGCGDAKCWVCGSATSGSASGGADHRGQGRPRTPGAALTHLLCHRGPLHERRTTVRTTSDSLFVSLKGPHRGQPLSTPGLDEIVRAARRRAGLSHGTCHELRHTCFTRLRKRGWPSRPSRPRPDTAPSPRRGSTYTWASTGWPTSTGGRRSHRGSGFGGGGPMTALAQSASLRRSPSGRRDTRGDVGRDHRPSAPNGRHYGLLPGPTRSLVPSVHCVSAVDLALRLLRPPGHRSRPTCVSVAAIGRPHIEDFKSWQAARPGKGASHCRPPPSGTGSASCAHSSNASSSGTTTTLRPGCPSTRATFPPSTNHCPVLGRSDGGQVHGRTGPPTPTVDVGSWSSCWPGPGCGSVSSPPSKTTPWSVSETSASSGSPSASCTTIVTFPCCRC